MSSSPFLPLPPGLEIAATQVVGDLLSVEVVSLRRTSCCPLCFQLPDRQKETAAAWMRTHPEIRQVSRDRGSEYAAAAAAGAPQAVQVADRYHIVKNLSEAVQLLLARVLTELKEASPQETWDADQPQAVAPLPLEEWRPAQDESVKRVIATRRAERQDRYQQLVSLREQGLSTQEISARMAMKERTVRQWFHRGVPPDSKQRRKYQSDFDPDVPYVLTRWNEGHRNGRQIWCEIAAQGYPGSERQVYRFLETLKSTKVMPTAAPPCLPHLASHTAVWLFVRDPQTLDEVEKEDLAAYCLASPTLNYAYQLIQAFLHMLRHRQGEQLDAWLTQVAESHLPELRSFARGV